MIDYVWLDFEVAQHNFLVKLNPAMCSVIVRSEIQDYPEEQVVLIKKAIQWASGMASDWVVVVVDPLVQVNEVEMNYD